MNEDTKRYVSIEQIARHKLQVTYPNDYHNGWNDAIDEILESQPADVQPVKHGRWQESRFGNGITVPFSKYYICDQCSHTAQKKSHYCPNCGAEMNRKRNKDAKIH